MDRGQAEERTDRAGLDGWRSRWKKEGLLGRWMGGGTGPRGKIHGGEQEVLVSVGRLAGWTDGVRG